MYEPLIPAQPTVNEHGVAEHPEYNDVYHSLSGAMGQADYVFLDGNGLPDRWRRRAQFTICETGFGLGNNFLTTWYRWRQDAQRSNKLHFVSFEAHPLYRADLKQQLQRTAPELQLLANSLIQQWPDLLPGVHRLEFDGGAVTLTLVFGRIEKTAALVDVQADAFFLDGFSPRLNPAMWTPFVFSQLVRMAAPAATLATWCTAGAVRRALQNAGFILEKRPGFAFKREMLMGVLRSHLGRTYAGQIPQKVAVVGAGIVGAATAHALAYRGLGVSIYDPVFGSEHDNAAFDLGASHAGHDAVAMVPLLARQDPPRARLSRLGIALARLRWQAWLGHEWFAGAAVTAAKDAQDAIFLQQTLEQLRFDPHWVQWQSSQGTHAYPPAEPQFIDMKHGDSQFIDSQCVGSSSETAAVTAMVHPPFGGLRFNRAFTVRPAALIRKLLASTAITPKAAQVTAVQPTTQGWMVHTSTGAEPFDAVILANAKGAHALLDAWVDDQSHPRFCSAGVVQGQVGSYAASATSWPTDGLMNGPGYILNNRQGQVVLGSTYDRTTQLLSWSADSQTQIEERMRPFLKAHFPVETATGGWVGERLAVRDHRPIIDQVASSGGGLWLATAMGSHGYSWAAVAAEQIAAQLCQEPRVLTLDLKRSVALR